MATIFFEDLKAENMKHIVFFIYFLLNLNLKIKLKVKSDKTSL